VTAAAPRRKYARALDEKAARKAREDLLTFTQYTFDGEYIVNWHHRLICRALEAFVRGEEDRLIISCPPRHGKSELCSRRLPAWILGRDPDARIIACSYGQDLATDMSRDAKRVVRSEAYQQVFPETQLPERHVVSDDRHAYKNTADLWEIVNYRGRYLARGVGGGITGKGGDFLLVDDPIKDDEEARSPTVRDRTWRWFNKVFKTRGSKDARILIIQTRWHEDDLVGRLERQMREVDEADDWTILNLPALYRDDVDHLHPEDPREPDEALWPYFKTTSDWKAIEETDPEGFAALGQGMPAPPGGAILQTRWTQQRYTELSTTRGRWIWSLDPKGGSTDEGSSEAVLQLWFQPESSSGQAYLVDQIKGIWTQSETEDAMLDAWKGVHGPLWQKAGAKLIEKTGDGPALARRLRDDVPGLELVDPGQASKEQRVRDVMTYWSSGNVYIPEPESNDWTTGFINQITKFPSAARDDQVDAMTQALAELFGVYDDEDNDSPLDRWDELL